MIEPLVMLGFAVVFGMMAVLLLVSFMIFRELRWQRGYWLHFGELFIALVESEFTIEEE